MGSCRALLPSSHPEASSVAWPSSRLAISNPFGAFIPQEQKHEKQPTGVNPFQAMR